jgi:hypothetical protein
MRIGSRGERHGYLHLMLLLQCRFSHVVVDSGDVCAQAEGDVGCIREGTLERSKHIGQSEQDGPDAKIRVLREGRLDDRAEEVPYASEVMQLRSAKGVDQPQALTMGADPACM